MPGGFAFDSTQSYVTFAVIKLIGYTVSTSYFNKRYSDVDANPLLFGLTRTLLGMLLGAVVGGVGLVTFQLAFWVFIICLVPFRIFEWYVTLRFFYGKSKDFNKSIINNEVIAGIAWSFLLDIPAIFGFIANGGFWIC